MNIKLSGDEINGESAIVVCNHRSLADHLLLAVLARHADPNRSRTHPEFSLVKASLTLPQINFFSWFLDWRVPCLRILINMIKCDENWELDAALGKQFFKKLINSNFPEWIIIFPEVNIWTPKSSIIQQQQNEKFYLPLFHGLLYPRFSSFHNLINAIYPEGIHKFSKIYDMTLAYEMNDESTPSILSSPHPNSTVVNSDMPDVATIPLLNPSPIYTPTLLDIFSSKVPITIRVHVKTRAITRVPIKRNKTEKYLENLWVEKNKQLQHMHNKAEGK